MYYCSLHKDVYQQQDKWYPKDVYMPLSKLYSILAIANLLAHSYIKTYDYAITGK